MFQDFARSLYNKFTPRINEESDHPIFNKYENLESYIGKEDTDKVKESLKNQLRLFPKHLLDIGNDQIGKGGIILHENTKGLLDWMDKNFKNNTIRKTLEDNSKTVGEKQKSIYGLWHEPTKTMHFNSALNPEGNGAFDMPGVHNHEFGHLVDYQGKHHQNPMWINSWNKDIRDPARNGKFNVGSYASISAKEGVAEMLRLMMLDKGKYRDRLMELVPNAYDYFMRSVMQK